MIGADTNVLIRLFVADDPVQHELAQRFFGARSRDDKAYVSLVTAVEFVWVLTRAYKQSQLEALEVLKIILSSEDTLVEAATKMRTAVEVALETGADFSDVLIADAALLAGCTSIATFDKQAAKRIPGMELLA